MCWADVLKTRGKTTVISERGKRQRKNEERGEKTERIKSEMERNN